MTALRGCYIQKEMLHTIVCIGVVFFCCIVNVLCVKKKKNREKLSWSKLLLLSGKKEYVCFLFMLIMNCFFAIVLSVYHQNSLAQDFRRICLLCLLWPIAWNDYKEQIIPNLFLKTGCFYWFLWIVLSVFSDREDLFMEVVRSLAAVLMVAIVCGICLLAMKNCMGMGDVKLLMVMGLLQGLTGLVSSVITSMVVLFFVCLFCLISRRKGRKDAIAFGPAVLVGTTISILLKGV